MRAAIYIRISRDTEGTELGVQRQEADCRAEAAKRGWDIAEVFSDNDVSATRSQSRPAYERMLTAARAGEIDAIVVWAVDRLTRSPRELEDVIDLAQTRGLAMANVAGEIDLSTYQGQMTARIIGAVARGEVDAQSRRLKRKFLEKAQKGEPHGYSPYGFTRVKDVESGAGRDVVLEAEAAVVREAARRVLDRESLRSIASDFNLREIHGPRAATWSPTVLRQILVRPANAGLRQYQGRVIGKSTSEPIYDEETFEKLTAFLNDPSRRSNHTGATPLYLMSGLAKCGREGCGGSMRRLVGRVAITKSGGKKRQPPAYGCSVCFRCKRKQEDVDRTVASAIVARLSAADAIDLFPGENSDAIRTAEAAMSSIQAKLEIVADQYAEDAITGDQLKRITARLRADEARHRARIRDSQPGPLATGMLSGDVATNWERLPIAAKRELVEALVEVTILPSGSGKAFNPEDIVIRWRAG